MRKAALFFFFLLFVNPVWSSMTYTEKIDTDVSHVGEKKVNGEMHVLPILQVECVLLVMYTQQTQIYMWVCSDTA